jgi:UDP-N-acetylmuramate dehydrogenase
VGGSATEVHAPESIAELVRVVGELRGQGRPFRLLGGGSNVIAADGPLSDPIVCMKGVASWEKSTPTLWRADAGVSLTEMVHRSARGGLTGMECCAGVPGTLGAAIRINAGGKFGTIASVLREVTVLTPSGAIERRATTPADFGYRKSIFWDDLILEARLEFTRDEPAAPSNRIRAVLDHKKSTQPLRWPSAGCIFRNPSRDQPAGRLIDEAGLKGARVGGALVSQLHANYIVNTGGATGSDFLALIDLVRRRVHDRSGIELELEVEVWI